MPVKRGGQQGGVLGPLRLRVHARTMHVNEGAQKGRSARLGRPNEGSEPPLVIAARVYPHLRLGRVVGRYDVSAATATATAAESAVATVR